MADQRVQTIVEGAREEIERATTRRDLDEVRVKYLGKRLSGQMGEPCQVTLSHEALELIADAEVNRLIMGPHPDPAQKGRMVFHWYEMCDAVLAERCISPTPWRDDAPKSNRSSASRGAAFKPLPTGRMPGSRVRAVPLIKSETGRAKAGGRRERSSG